MAGPSAPATDSELVCLAVAQALLGYTSESRCLRFVYSRLGTMFPYVPAHGPLPRPRGKPGLMALVPQRADLGDEFSDHTGRQAGDPPVADDHCTSHIPHHTTVINDHNLDVSPPTMHEPLGH
ncbi:hypothetical protein ABZS86_35530 [Streptomyces sp. NPDC005355]|uniref:hypothetical protein n=1 Tax=Streptomyces sp. NPDC005355 TaxID=3157038 RepID=UPI0033AB4D88